MSEEMHPPPLQQSTKARISPLEFRNTDLVSRLLAATPPYLYNMPLVPHTYFFSEMLRSFVQAKTDNAQRNQQTLIPPQRRTRKRSWTNVNYHHKQEQKLAESATKEMPPPPPASWTPKMYLEKGQQHCSVFDKPLELTMKTNKDLQSAESEHKNAPLISFPSADLSQQDQMVLPPPPPLWYPPLYPPGTSYPSTFDPLHFFIDLRVSGHIYDRKAGTAKDEKPKEDAAPSSPLSYFKQSRHCSAFSVPNNQNASNNNNFPMNLTNSGDVKMKFDVKSMGFDKKDSGNRTGSNYIMQNIDGIYKNINTFSVEEVSDTKIKEGEEEGGNKDTDEDKKKDKDLRALIGLELVVDYMSNRKKVPHKAEELERPAEKESGNVSPAVEVVAINENDSFVYN